jgi:signal transduction histidine kinase
VIALLHTASLYQKDLDRQLMLEKATRDVQIKSHDHGKELMDRLNKIATSSREMNSRLNLIVWALNPKYNNLENLVSYLRRYFGEYLENFGIRFKTALPDRIPDLSITPDTRRNIFYAIQEAIHNAVKHSSCSEISLVVKIDQQNMEITITDNGKGFDQLKPGSGGNGLLNMRKRAEELGGSFEINSLPSKGTKVMLIFRL